jgi:hypothetical protein
VERNAVRSVTELGHPPGEKQTGRFLPKAEPEYEDASRSLVLKEVAAIKPRTIVLWWLEVTSRAYTLMPALVPWRGRNGPI